VADRAVTAPEPAGGFAPPFRYLLRVRYGECDSQKVVYNARYGDYVDLAAGEFLRVVWGDAVFGGGYDYQLVRQLIEWRASLRYDEIVQITVSLAQIGTTSFVLAMELRPLGAPRPAAAAETTYVLTTEGELTKCVIPDDLRRRLEAGAPGVVIDHAGAGTARGPGTPAPPG
jgi:acyl-CoA thioester hydrolase